MGGWVGMGVEGRERGDCGGVHPISNMIQNVEGGAFPNFWPPSVTRGHPQLPSGATARQVATQVSGRGHTPDSDRVRRR